MERKEQQERIEKLFKENKIYYEWEIDPDTDVVSVYIDLGDWKHDHLYIDYLMRENDFKQIGETVTFEDGDDCYGSIHEYKYSSALAELHKIIKGEE